MLGNASFSTSPTKEWEICMAVPSVLSSLGIKVQPLNFTQQFQHLSACTGQLG